MGLLVLGTVLGALVLVVLTVAVVVVRRRDRRRQSDRSALEAELASSQMAVARLTSQVDELSLQLTEVRRALQDARTRQSEYVITSLVAESAGSPVAQLMPARTARPRAHALEDQLVGVLATQQDISAVRTRIVEMVVRTVALGHGVRRALSPDVLDRAAAESHVARRRSRRNRKREEREAKRLLRAVKEQRAA